MTCKMVQCLRDLDSYVLFLLLLADWLHGLDASVPLLLLRGEARLVLICFGMWSGKNDQLLDQLWAERRQMPRYISTPACKPARAC